ncbi:hypothetical protein skT53_17180 [Effusibacillus dendaii]|uniref:Mutator family transposase n=1 Tax=Effusibacillus dendaii TaxID=2743772 RepID=A0A7I8D9A8_9BACL|nr:hypothetical protein skT53_17180 [Effusibacillus dendaii]
MVSSIVRTIFAQPTQETTKEQLAVVVEQLKNRFPKAMEILQRAEEDVLAYIAFPKEHWRQICSTNPLERLNREIRRRMVILTCMDTRLVELLKKQWESRREKQKTSVWQAPRFIIRLVRLCTLF